MQYGIPLLVYQDGFVIVERNQFQRIPVALQGLAGTRFEGIFPDMRENGVVKYIEGRVIRESGRKGFVVHDLVVFNIGCGDDCTGGFADLEHALPDAAREQLCEMLLF